MDKVKSGASKVEWWTTPAVSETKSSKKFIEGYRMLYDFLQGLLKIGGCRRFYNIIKGCISWNKFIEWCRRL